jgi:hypothetical protein
MFASQQADMSGAPRAEATTRAGPEHARDVSAATMTPMIDSPAIPPAASINTAA